MNLILKFIVTVSLGLTNLLASANTVVSQLDSLAGGFNAYDGRSIHLNFDFQKPILQNEIVEILFNNKRALLIKNETSSLLERFSTRFRFNVGESLLVKTPSSSTVFVPRVTTNYYLPKKDSFDSNRIMSRVVESEISKAYKLKIGDCAFLVSGISNSGSQLPRSFTIKINNQDIFIESSERVSDMTFFSAGLNESATTCSMKIE
jgi:hypothetical protein